MSEALLKEILNEIKGMKTELGSLNQRVEKIDQSVEKLDHKVENLDQRVEGLDHKVENLDQRVEKLDQHVGNLDQRVGNLEEGQAVFVANVHKLELKIENEVIEKIRALFDDREVQNHRLECIEVKLDGIIVDLSYLVTNVARLERIAK